MKSVKVKMTRSAVALTRNAVNAFFKVSCYPPFYRLGTPGSVT